MAGTARSAPSTPPQTQEPSTPPTQSPPTPEAHSERFSGERFAELLLRGNEQLGFGRRAVERMTWREAWRLQDDFEAGWVVEWAPRKGRARPILETRDSVISFAAWCEMMQDVESRLSPRVRRGAPTSTLSHARHLRWTAQSWFATGSRRTEAACSLPASTRSVAQATRVEIGKTVKTRARPTATPSVSCGSMALSRTGRWRKSEPQFTTSGRGRRKRRRCRRWHDTGSCLPSVRVTVPVGLTLRLPHLPTSRSRVAQCTNGSRKAQIYA